MIGIGLLGLGTVGSGLVRLLDENCTEIQRRTDCQFVIEACLVRDRHKPRDCTLQPNKITDCIDDVICHPKVDIVVELIGGDTLALTAVRQALAQGKSVVTANKALIAKHGDELCLLACENDCSLRFEAAVGGCIPIVKTVRESLAGNQIQWLAGIINGTSNFILTQMTDNHSDFADVLALAQQLGYAEADPSFDIEGVDAAHKLTILASLAFGVPLNFDDVHCEGISHITAADIAYIKELGYCVKHLAIAEYHEGGLQLRVHPALLPQDHILAHVNGAMNAVFVQANAAGPTLYYGAGAGAQPTASAIAADLIDIIQGNTGTPVLGFDRAHLIDVSKLTLNCTEAVYYLRLHLLDQPGALAEITKILGQHDISIEVLLQKSLDSKPMYLPVVIMTHVALEKNMKNALCHIVALETVQGEVVSIRKPLLVN